MRNVLNHVPWKSCITFTRCRGLQFTNDIGFDTVAFKLRTQRNCFTFRGEYRMKMLGAILFFNYRSVIDKF
jgi:hypothetical protein